MSRGRLTLACLLVAVWIYPKSHEARADDDANRAHALELFDESDRAYKAGDFARAADLVRGAYALYPEPILLYNLGRALERTGDTRGAIEQYERYLDAAPTADDATDVRAKIASLRAALPVDRPVVVAAPAPRVIVKEAPRHRPVVPMSAMVVGLASVGTGIGFGLASTHLHDQAVREPVQLDARRDLDRAQRDATVANILYVGGGALAIGGAVWTYFAVRHHDGGPMVTVSPQTIGLAWELK